MVNKTPEKHLKANRVYQRSEHGKAIVSRLQKKYREAKRLAVIGALGNVCTQCGFSDIRALQVDHINGGGRQERQEISNVSKYYSLIIKSVVADEDKYQLLCANCNVIKRIVNKEF